MWTQEVNHHIYSFISLHKTGFEYPNEDATGGTIFGTIVCILTGLAVFYGAYQAHQPDFIEKSKAEITLHRYWEINLTTHLILLIHPR